MNNNSDDEYTTNVLFFGVVALTIGGCLKDIKFEENQHSASTFSSELWSSFINGAQTVGLFICKMALLALLLFLTFKILEFVYKMTWKKISINRALADDLHFRMCKVEIDFKKSNHTYISDFNSLQKQINSIHKINLKLVEFTGLTAYEKAQEALKSMKIDEKKGSEPSEQA